MAVDVPPTTPVLIGAAQHTERREDPDYAALSPADLAAVVARAALADAGLGAEAVDVLACTRQFDESFPGMPATLGRPDHFTAAVAQRLGARPQECLYEVAGGQSPQHLVTELGGRIAAGELRAAVIVSAEAISTVLDLARSPEPPDYSETVTADVGRRIDRGAGLGGLVTRVQVVHGLTDAPTQYALFEHARRGRKGWSRAELAADMGAWFAPFTRIAAANPYAVVREERTAAQLMEVTPANRVIVDPFPKSVVAREKVNQAAAVVLVSAELADELGVAAEGRVFLHGHADLHDVELLQRPDLGRSEPSVRAITEALDLAGVALDDVAHLDLYSCFPIAVSVVAEELGLDPEDPRGLTVTGGLPFFGGPGNGYSLHAVAEVVDRCRRTPGSIGLVGANGGMLSKYSAGVYATDPVPWRPGRSAAVQAELDARPPTPVAAAPEGPAVVETWTVQYGPGLPGGRRGIVVGRLTDGPDAGRRFLANTHLEDAGEGSLLALLEGEDGPGAAFAVRPTPTGNVAARDVATLDALLGPVAAPVRLPAPGAAPLELPGVRVTRHDAVVEVAVLGEGERHLLTPAVSRTLAGVWDAVDADPEVRAAVLTGAGDDAFCGDADLAEPSVAMALGLPASGVGGLTARTLRTPVIAAVTGDAVGSPLELVLVCHLIVAAQGTRFALPHQRVGLLSAGDGPRRLLARLPHGLAHRLILTGTDLPVARAHELGLVDELVPSAQVRATALALAQEVALSSPTSVGLALGVLAGDGPGDTEDALDRLLVSTDASLGVQAAYTGEPPRWAGR